MKCPDLLPCQEYRALILYNIDIDYKLMKTTVTTTDETLGICVWQLPKRPKHYENVILYVGNNDNHTTREQQ